LSARLIRTVAADPKQTMDSLDKFM